MDIGNSSSNRAHPQKHYRHYAPLQEHRKPQNASKSKRPFLLAQAVPLASLSPWLHPSYLLNKDLHRRTLPSLTTLVPLPNPNQDHSHYGLQLRKLQQLLPLPFFGSKTDSRCWLDRLLLERRSEERRVGK